VAIDLLKVAVVLYAVYAATLIVASYIVGFSLVLADFAIAAAFDWLVGLAVAAVCFTKDTKVTMADGTKKAIKDVKTGDKVFNHNMTKINTVTRVEVTVVTELTGLYSPDAENAPFATLNHPLYVNGKLSSLSPAELYKIYPWLGMTEKITAARSGPLQVGELLYNLYLDGDHTYIVNGYGTHNISGDAGGLGIAMDYGHITQQRVTELFKEFTEDGPEIAYGAFILNNFLRFKVKLFNKIAAQMISKPKESFERRVFAKVAKFIGKQAIKRQEKQAKK
jgi:hypothetical protein